MMAKSKKQAAPAAADTYVPRLRKRYQDEVMGELGKEFEIANVMAIPRVEKIVLNIGLGEATQNIKILDEAVEELAQIAGQRPTITRALPPPWNAPSQSSRTTPGCGTAWPIRVSRKVVWSRRPDWRQNPIPWRQPIAAFRPITGC